LVKARYIDRTRIVWVVHNLRPHDKSVPKFKIFERIFLNCLSGIILLSKSSLHDLKNDFSIPGHVKTLVTTHGKYSSHGSQKYSNNNGKKRLLFFGLIRQYKNLEDLILSFNSVNGSALELKIVGCCKDTDYREIISKLSKTDPRINLDIRDHPLAEPELESEIDAARAVILPYRKILNSGSVIHALSRTRPILAPRLGSLTELQKNVGCDWLHLYEGELTTSTIEKFLADIENIETDKPDLESLDWSRISAELRRFWQELGFSEGR
jgi:glycosyltransferase involved in cell wall biosynthesis